MTVSEEFTQRDIFQGESYQLVHLEYLLSHMLAGFKLLDCVEQPSNTS